MSVETRDPFGNLREILISHWTKSNSKNFATFLQLHLWANDSDGICDTRIIPARKFYTASSFSRLKKELIKQGDVLRHTSNHIKIPNWESLIDNVKFLRFLNKLELEVNYENMGFKKIDVTPEKGFVYLAFSDSGQFRIGKSKNPKRRIHDLNSSFPFLIKLIAFKEFEDAYSMEAKLHKIYDNQRIKGEWFQLNQDQVNKIIGILT